MDATIGQGNRVHNLLGKRLRVVAAAAAVAVAIGAAPGAHAESAATTTYGPSFAAGPTGGDRYNVMSADPGGRVTAARVHPSVGNVASCGGQAGYTKLLVEHQPIVGTVDTIDIAFTEALVDPYVFVTVGVRDTTGRWVGSSRLRGATGDGVIHVDLYEAPAPGPVAVEFGLELSSACPSADAGTLRFTSVTVNEE